MKISIVVPAFNEERLLAKSLVQIKKAAKAFEKIGWAVELIVCDNNSTDKTAEIARAAGATVVFEPVNQIARARNCGAAAATGDWLIFVDADSHPGAELFSDVAHTIQSGRCLAGGATIHLDEKHFAAGIFVMLWNCASRIFKLIAGSFIFCDATAFQKIGGFSDKLFAGEEIDLSQRLKKLAKQTGKKIIILHRHSLITSARKMKLYTLREHLKVFVRFVMNRGAMTQRESCALWYDGRR